MIKVGFAGLRRRAKLSNAVGYSPRDAPRPQRGMESLRESNQGSNHNPHQDLDKRGEWESSHTPSRPFRAGHPSDPAILWL